MRRGFKNIQAFSRSDHRRYDQKNASRVFSVAFILLLPLSSDVKKLSSEIPTAALQMYKHPNKLIDYLHTLEVDAYNPYDKITNHKTVGSLGEAGFLSMCLRSIKQSGKKSYLAGVEMVFLPTF